MSSKEGDAGTGNARADYLLRAIANLGKVSYGECQQLADANEIADFLDDPSCRFMQATVSAEGRVTLTNNAAGASKGGGDGTCINFVKVRPETLRGDSMASSIVVSSQAEKNSALQGLYHMVHDVYGPALQQGAGSSTCSAGVQPSV